MGDGGWGIGKWGVGPIHNPQSPIPIYNNINILFIKNKSFKKKNNTLYHLNINKK